MAKLSVQKLFETARVPLGGRAPWNTTISEQGSGVYVLTLRGAKQPALNKLSRATASRWIRGQDVIYIGRGKNLRRRLQQFYRHKHGRSSPHRGGQDVLLLKRKMTVHWGKVDDYVAAERRMMEAFEAAADSKPFANRVRAAKAA